MFILVYGAQTMQAYSTIYRSYHYFIADLFNFGGQDLMFLCKNVFIELAL